MTAPRLSAGELGVSTPTKDYLFKPSFSAIASLGSPSAIVELFSFLHSSPKINPYFPRESYRRWERDILDASARVLDACCDEDISELIGYIGSKPGSYVYGLMPMEHWPHLARALMTHGITGNIKPRRKLKQEDYSPTFDAKEYVATAIAHLGLSEDEAWSMTMTTFTSAMQAKFGKPEDSVDDLIDTREADMAWLDSINKLRDRKKA